MPPGLEDVSATPFRSRRYALGLFGFLSHSVVFAFAATDSVLAWLIPLYIDYPATTLSDELPGIFICGGLLWFLYGFILQSVFSLRKRSDWIWLTLALALLACMFIPRLMLFRLPGWQREWTLGTSPVYCGARDSDSSIRHVSEAIRLATREENLSNGMSYNLAHIHWERLEYDQTEQTFLSEIALILDPGADRNLSRDDMEQLSLAYDDLSFLYDLRSDFKKEGEALLQDIKWARLAYANDPGFEANGWSRLAELSYKEGDHKNGIDLMEKAIAMAAPNSHPGDGQMEKMQRELTEWKAAP